MLQPFIGRELTEEENAITNTERQVSILPICEMDICPPIFTVIDKIKKMSRTE